MSLLDKIQKKSILTRKIILWSIVIIVALASIFLYIKYAQKKLSSYRNNNQKELKLPNIKEELDGLKNLEFPTFSQEELKKIEEELNKAEQSTATATSAATTTK